MRYRQARVFGDGEFDQALRGVAVTGGTVYAAGDSRVTVFDLEGATQRYWWTEMPGYSIAVGGSDPVTPQESGPATVWVGQAGQIEVFDLEGGRLDVWRDAERLGLVTAIGFTRDGVLAADAAARCIRHYDRGGNFRNNIGDRHRKGGFHIPNGVVDFAVDSRGIVHVANPGMHRVERYTPDGELVGRFGRFDGVDPEGFPGCCNPTNVTLTSSGRVVVTEKAPPRVKIYDSEGQLLTVVAADEAFDPAAKNMDVATGFMDRIYVADTAGRQICVFERTEKQS